MTTTKPEATIERYSTMAVSAVSLVFPQQVIVQKMDVAPLPSDLRRSLHRRRVVFLA
jgi:hypothetical protein